MTTHDTFEASPGRLSRDAGILTGRALRHQYRHVDGLIMGLVLPLMLLVMFVYVFGGALGGDGGRSAYVDYVVPGIVVLAAGFSAAQVAPAVTLDLTGGTIDRLRAMGTSPVALLAGHVLANLARNVVSTIGVVLLALLMGFGPRAGVLGWLAAAGVAIAFMGAIATVSATMGIAASSPETASGFTFFVLFLPYLSTGFVPPQTLPSVLRGFAEHQPMTPVIETMRGLLLGGSVGADAWLALAWCVGIVAVSVPVAAWLFRRRAAPR
ncbi:MAG TPA: ABC transporter permease [Egicoccus sp.]|nr:ABC transporter permease [Egicoccus sp.]HSK24070.1 ABC transporter permease [Egicoccus sp.]